MYLQQAESGMVLFGAPFLLMKCIDSLAFYSGSHCSQSIWVGTLLIFEMEHVAISLTEDRSKSFVLTHTCKQCLVHAHNDVPTDDTYFIHAIFPGKSCMDILHSEEGKEIWKVRARKVSVNYKHNIDDFINPTDD